VADGLGITNSGKSYVILGRPYPDAAGSIDINALDGSNGFVINGIDIDDFSGFSVSGAGDMNGK
jgi:hypothetical protein